ncbi:MAG: metallophosphoesterase family protein [Draconibacterium sp.]
MKIINRRDFIKGASLTGVAGIFSTTATASILPSSLHIDDGQEAEVAVNHELRYNGKGKFKIVQFTDTHYISGDPLSERALKNVNEILDAEQPDLVIHTGDAIYGKPAELSMREILEPMSERKIPFAITFGNHDDEHDKTREELFDIIQGIPYYVGGTSQEISGITNSVITLTNQNKKIEHVFYLFDSNAYSTIEGIKGYGHIHFDQIEWYRRNSRRFTEINNGKPVPSLAFFHIPIPEYSIAADDANVIMAGTRGEKVCCPAINSGLFTSMKEMGDIRATFVGHDHNNDYVTYWNKLFLFYGRFSGCDTVYNDIKPNGARIIEYREGEDGFSSWIRLYGGEIIQKHHFPNDFSWRDA